MTFCLLKSTQAFVIYHHEEVKIARIDRVRFPDTLSFDLNRDGISNVEIRAFLRLNFDHLGVDVIASPSHVEFLSE
jgi:hypothetical protein